MKIPILLIALALEICSWQPVPVPSIFIVEDQIYENLENRYGIDKYTRAFVIPEQHMIVLRKSTANDRVICHEFRHIVESEWKHD